MSSGTTVPVTLPQMGESVAEGTVLEWLKQPGETVTEGEDIVVISTDKVDTEIPAPATGVLRHLAAEGETVASGTVVAEIEVGAAAEVAPAASAPDQGSTEETTQVDIVTPSAGDSVTEATLLEWLVAVGDSVSEGQDIVVVSTDKVDMELPSPASGVVTELLFADGDTIHPHEVIGRIAAGAVSQASPGDSPSSPAAPTAASATSPAADDSSVLATPVARRMAAATGVNLAAVAGSGRNGKVTISDVLEGETVQANSSFAARVEPSQTPLRGGAAMLAQYMDESLQVPTATSFRTITIHQLDGRRKQLKDAGHKVSFTHLIAYAIARAATEQMPVMAHTYEVVDGKANVNDHGQVNLGIAVDVERRGTRTLMVPVIKDAGRLTFTQFLDAFNELIAKARDNKLTADDLQGANVQLTNPGGIGTSASVPRLMQGNGTIIATGAIGYPVGLQNIGAQIGAEKVMSLTSTYDHRIIQGAQSGEFLKTLDEYLAGDHGFYESVFGDLGLTAGDPIAPPVPTGTLTLGSAAAAGAAISQSADSAGDAMQLLQAVQAATSLIKAIRSHGHLVANIDPLEDPSEADEPALLRRIGLDPDKLGLTAEHFKQIPAEILRVHVPGETLEEVAPNLRNIYTGSTAYEVEHISNDAQRVWLREKIESGEFSKPLANDRKKILLERLIQVDEFEQFMQRAYLGQKRFSIEGLDVAVPLIDKLIRLAAKRASAKRVVVGMAHRGRLNVLAHNLGRPYAAIFTEFEGGSALAAAKTVTQSLHGGTGDVKYHHGATGRFEIEAGRSIEIKLESNPSHLEYVNPVVLGSTRANQTSRKQAGKGVRDEDIALPIVIHGDAAFPGQGVVAESLNLQGLEGYRVGGSVHLILNNQIGFTTEPSDDRSTNWASDLAKGFDVPIIHVNADDVEACINAAVLAFSFRQEFGHDVLIDIVGYRRYGHNETDEPAYTQPLMAKKIKGHKRVSDIYRDQLVATNVLSADEGQAIRQKWAAHLSEQHAEVKRKVAEWEELGAASDTNATGSYLMDRSRSVEPVTRVDRELLERLNRELLKSPDDFTPNAKLQKQLERRLEVMGEEGGIEWAHAEALALASLACEGVPVRLTGQDAERGTFSQRHLVLHDSENGNRYTPIQNLVEAKAAVELHNSPLSEVAALGFEYGYANEAPEALVLWEGQFGDFGNCAQVIIDQFIVSGVAKWGQTSRLTMLLPHGYEGAGPEHSSARLERYLQLAAEGNIRVANVTTPAQYFHLLRRQALIEKQRPLVVMTPKSLLRLPSARSRLSHLADAQFFPVLGEPGIDINAVTRLVLCTGKIFYDLRQHEERNENPKVAIGRVEMLYPFPEEHISELITQYPNLREVVWVQEEPRNMGARAYMYPRLQQMIGSRGLALGYVGRPDRASPSEGYPTAHNQEQNRICTTALNTDIPVSQHPKRAPGDR